MAADIDYAALYPNIGNYIPDDGRPVRELFAGCDVDAFVALIRSLPPVTKAVVVEPEQVAG